MNVSQMANASCRLLGFEPNADELADVIEALNLMLQEWSVSPNGIFAVTRESFTLTIGTAEYTWGTAGTWTTARPNRIVNAFIREGDIDRPLATYFGSSDYAALSQKASPGRPTALYHERSYPLAKVLLYPTPDAAYVLHVYSLKPLGAYTSGSDDLALPPEFEPAIKFNLALDLSLEFGKPVEAFIVKRAADTLAALKGMYAHAVPQISTDPFGAEGSGAYSYVEQLSGSLSFGSGNYLTF